MNSSANAPAPKYRPVTFGVTRVTVREGAGDTAGSRYVTADQPLANYPDRITDRLIHWAKEAPDRIWMAKREKRTDADGTVTTGDWKQITFAQALGAARSMGQALLDRGLGVNRPVAILSENDL